MSTALLEEAIKELLRAESDSDVKALVSRLRPSIAKALGQREDSFGLEDAQEYLMGLMAQLGITKPRLEEEQPFHIDEATSMGDLFSGGAAPDGDAGLRLSLDNWQQAGGAGAAAAAAAAWQRLQQDAASSTERHQGQPQGSESIDLSGQAAAVAPRASNSSQALAPTTAAPASAGPGSSDGRRIQAGSVRRAGVRTESSGLEASSSGRREIRVVPGPTSVLIPEILDVGEIPSVTLYDDVLAPPTPPPPQQQQQRSERQGYRIERGSAGAVGGGPSSQSPSRSSREVFSFDQHSGPGGDNPAAQEDLDGSSALMDLSGIQEDDRPRDAAQGAGVPAPQPQPYARRGVGLGPAPPGLPPPSTPVPGPGGSLVAGGAVTRQVFPSQAGSVPGGVSASDAVRAVGAAAGAAPAPAVALPQAAEAAISAALSSLTGGPSRSPPSAPLPPPRPALHPSDLYPNLALLAGGDLSRPHEPAAIHVPPRPRVHVDKELQRVVDATVSALQPGADTARRAPLPWLDIPSDPRSLPDRVRALTGDVFDYDLAKAEAGVVARLAKEVQAAAKDLFPKSGQSNLYHPQPAAGGPLGEYGDENMDLDDMEAFKRAIGRDIEARLAVSTDVRERDLKEAARVRAAEAAKAEAAARKARAAAAALEGPPETLRNGAGATRGARPGTGGPGVSTAGKGTGPGSAPAAPAAPVPARVGAEDRARLQQQKDERARLMARALAGSPGASQALTELRLRNLLGGSTRRGVDPLPSGELQEARERREDMTDRPVIAFGRRVDRPLPLPPRNAIWNSQPIKGQLPRVAGLANRIQRGREVLRLPGRPSAPPGGTNKGNMPLFYTRGGRPGTAPQGGRPGRTGPGGPGSAGTPARRRLLSEMLRVLLGATADKMLGPGVLGGAGAGGAGTGAGAGGRGYGGAGVAGGAGGTGGAGDARSDGRASTATGMGTGRGFGSSGPQFESVAGLDGEGFGSGDLGMDATLRGSGDSEVSREARGVAEGLSDWLTDGILARVLLEYRQRKDAGVGSSSAAGAASGLAPGGVTPSEVNRLRAVATDALAEEISRLIQEANEEEAGRLLRGLRSSVETLRGSSESDKSDTSQELMGLILKAMEDGTVDATKVEQGTQWQSQVPTPHLPPGYDMSLFRVPGLEDMLANAGGAAMSDGPEADWAAELERRAKEAAARIRGRLDKAQRLMDGAEPSTSDSDWGGAGGRRGGARRRGGAGKGAGVGAGAGSGAGGAGKGAGMGAGAGSGAGGAGSGLRTGDGGLDGLDPSGRGLGGFGAGGAAGGGIGGGFGGAGAGPSAGGAGPGGAGGRGAGRRDSLDRLSVEDYAAYLRGSLDKGLEKLTAPLGFLSGNRPAGAGTDEGTEMEDRGAGGAGGAGSYRAGPRLPVDEEAYLRRQGVGTNADWKPEGLPRVTLLWREDKRKPYAATWKPLGRANPQESGSGSGTESSEGGRFPYDRKGRAVGARRGRRTVTKETFVVTKDMVGNAMLYGLNALQPGESGAFTVSSRPGTETSGPASSMESGAAAGVAAAQGLAPPARNVISELGRFGVRRRLGEPRVYNDASLGSDSVLRESRGEGASDESSDDAPAFKFKADAAAEELTDARIRDAIAAATQAAAATGRTYGIDLDQLDLASLLPPLMPGLNLDPYEIRAALAGMVGGAEEDSPGEEASVAQDGPAQVGGARRKGGKDKGKGRGVRLSATLSDSSLERGIAQLSRAVNRLRYAQELPKFAATGYVPEALSNMDAVSDSEGDGQGRTRRRGLGRRAAPKGKAGPPAAPGPSRTPSAAQAQAPSSTLDGPSVASQASQPAPGGPSRTASGPSFPAASGTPSGPSVSAPIPPSPLPSMTPQVPVPWSSSAAGVLGVQADRSSGSEASLDLGVSALSDDMYDYM